MAGFFRSLVRHHSRLVSEGRTVGHKNGPEASGASAGAAHFRTDLGAAAVYLPRSRRYKLTITTAALAAGLLLQANNAPPVLAAQSFPFNGIASGHPFENLTLGDYSAPALVDIDNDGDLDVFVGNTEYIGDPLFAWAGTIKFFRNTGTASSPVFVEETATNPLAAVAGLGLYHMVPALADIDHDGDLDAFIGEQNGTIKFLRNTGTAASPIFVEETGASNPLDVVAGLGLEYTAPSLVDIDHDGDLDAFIGGNEYLGFPDYLDIGTIKFFRNTNNDSIPIFAEETGLSNPLAAVAGLGLYNTAPALVDIDQDGDLDAFIGDYYGTIIFFKNTGNDSAPVFSQQTGVANPFDGIDVGDNAVPAFGDLNGDGSREAVVGQSAGPLAYFVRLDPRQPPAAVNDPGSAMFTLEDIYYRLRYGNDSVKRPGAFVGPNTGPQPSGFTLDEVMKNVPQPLPANDSSCARPADVAAGQWFWSTCVDTWGLRQGTGAGQP